MRAPRSRGAALTEATEFPLRAQCRRIAKVREQSCPLVHSCEGATTFYKLRHLSRPPGAANSPRILKIPVQWRLGPSLPQAGCGTRKKRDLNETVDARSPGDEPAGLPGGTRRILRGFGTARCKTIGGTCERRSAAHG